MEIMDHGAFGTLIIGLEAVRREQELRDEPMARPHHAARVRTVRLAIARSLRRLADAVDAPRLARA
jgi:hypothetical protein